MKHIINENDDFDFIKNIFLKVSDFHITHLAYMLLNVFNRKYIWFNVFNKNYIYQFQFLEKYHLINNKPG